MKARVWRVILIFAMLLGIITGLVFRQVKDFSSYECTDSWMYIIRMDGSHSIDLRLQEGTLLQVELDVFAGRVRTEVFDAQGRSLPVIGGWALIPAAGRYTVRFRGKSSAFRVIVQCYRDHVAENRSATEQAGFALCGIPDTKKQSRRVATLLRGYALMPLRPGILGGVGQGLGLVVGDILNAQVLEDLEQGIPWRFNGWMEEKRTPKIICIAAFDIPADCGICSDSRWRQGRKSREIHRAR